MATPRLLVVDDSRMQRAIVSALLRNWGYLVEEAASGAEALEHCRKWPVDVVVSDWNMPDMSGPELCRAFRALSRDSYGYFILLTSNPDRAAVARGLEEGADDVLAKPFTQAELRARIHAGERLLRMERELQAKNRLVTETLAKLQEVHDSLDRDLRQARRMQRSLLGERHRDYGAVQVSLLLRPAGHVGGDLVGSFGIGTERVGLFCFDVSGHGLSSALVTARLAGLFSGAIPEHNIALTRADDAGFVARSPEHVAGDLNRLLLREMEAEHYCTLIYGDIELATGRVRLVQAGHPHPLILRASGKVEVIGHGGLPVGLLPEARYEGVTALLRPGDRLMLVSDGITECPDVDGRQLDQEGFIRLLHRLRDLRGTTFHEALMWDLCLHAGGAEFPDDISAILLEYAGPPEAAGGTAPTG